MPSNLPGRITFMVSITTLPRGSSRQRPIPLTLICRAPAVATVSARAHSTLRGRATSSTKCLHARPTDWQPTSRNRASAQGDFMKILGSAFLSAGLLTSCAVAAKDYPHAKQHASSPSDWVFGGVTGAQMRPRSADGCLITSLSTLRAVTSLSGGVLLRFDGVELALIGWCSWRTSASCSTPWSQGSTRLGRCRARAAEIGGNPAPI